MSNILRHYAVRHNIGKSTQIIFIYTNGESDSVLVSSIEEAGFIIDLLRNEKPISYEKASNSLTTAEYEPIGENE